MSETYDFGDGPVPAHRHKHSDGTLGGWVADTAWVSVKAWVFGHAQVFGTAQVLGNARVSDHAQVFGAARVYGIARVSDHAQVFGNAQVYGNALVSGSARVYGNALVSGSAQVYGNAHASSPDDILTIGLIGSRADTLTWTRSDNRICTGCFSGTLDEFRAAVVDTHGTGRYATEYLAVVAFIEALAAARTGDSSD